jgi:hypothetical protein
MHEPDGDRSMESKITARPDGSFEVPAERRSEYLKLMEMHNANRIDYNIRKWETLKYFQSIVLALLGASVVAVTVGIDRGLFCKSLTFSTAFAFVISALPVLIIVASLLAIANLRRETALLFAEEAECFKLAKLLDLDLHLPTSKRWIPGDARLLMPKWRNWSRGIGDANSMIDFDEWVRRRSSSHRFASISNLLFGVEAAVAAQILCAVFALYGNAQFQILPALGGCEIAGIGRF